MRVETAGRWIVVMGSVCGLTMTLRVDAAADCQKAEKELRVAQQKLSVATRRADSKGAAYYACMKKHRNQGQTCSVQRRAFDQANARKQRAKEAYRFARGRRDAACR